jgi:hypothetical protein
MVCTSGHGHVVAAESQGIYEPAPRAVHMRPLFQGGARARSGEVLSVTRRPRGTYCMENSSGVTIGEGIV